MHVTFYDENGAFTKSGDVPAEFTEDLLQPPNPSSDSEAHPS